MRRDEAEEVIDLAKKGSAGGEILKMEFVKRVCELVIGDIEEQHAAKVAELQAHIINLEEYSKRLLKESAALEAELRRLKAGQEAAVLLAETKGEKPGEPEQEKDTADGAAGEETETEKAAGEESAEPETAEENGADPAEDKADDADPAAGGKPKRKAGDYGVKQCIICGREFKPKSGRTKYCDSCKKDKKREQNKICERNRQARIREEKKADKTEAEVFEADAIAKEKSDIERFASELAAME